MFANGYFLLAQLRSESNATRDILRNNDMWKAQLESAEWFVNLINSGFATAISVIGLFIIGSALLRNVIAGAVAAYPKFWEKVHHVHKTLKLNKNILSQLGSIAKGEASFQSSIEGSEAEESSITMLLYWIIPDFLGISDLDKKNVRARTYFVQAIPKMFAVVALGIFIWNGYYRETAAVVGDMGAAVVEKALFDTDPVAFVDKMFNLAAVPDFGATLGSGGLGSVQTQLGREIWAATVSRFDDIQGRVARDSMQAKINEVVEAMLMEVYEGNFSAGDRVQGGANHSGADFFDDEKFSRTFNLTVVSNTSGASQLQSMVHDANRHVEVRSGREVYTTIHTIADIRSTFGFDSRRYPDEAFDIRVTLQFARKALRGNTGIVRGDNVYWGGGTWPQTASGAEATFSWSDFPGTRYAGVAQPGNHSVEITVSGGQVTIKGTGSSASTPLQGIERINLNGSIQFQHEGRSVVVTSIRFDGTTGLQVPSSEPEPEP